MAPSIPVLLVTGPIGAGETAVASEVSELLRGANAAHADSLRACSPSHPHDPYNIDLAMRSLAAIWRNYRAAGARRLIPADVLRAREDPGRYREAAPGASIRVVRLRAAPETLASRARRRELARPSSGTCGGRLSWRRRWSAALSRTWPETRRGSR